MLFIYIVLNFKRLESLALSQQPGSAPEHVVYPQPRHSTGLSSHKLHFQAEGEDDSKTLQIHALFMQLSGLQ